MFPPPQNLNIDARAISGIAGSISIACWVIVFSPQIIVNFRRGSAEGLSLTFLAVWLLGDVFNVLGAVLQGVLPTMIILAVYYTLADIVLLAQCLYYRHRQNSVSSGATSAAISNAIGTNIHSNPDDIDEDDDEDEDLRSDYGEEGYYHHLHHNYNEGGGGQGLSSSAVHLSPATPLLDPPKLLDETINPPQPATARSIWISIILNTTAVIMVCLAGVVGWYLTTPTYPPNTSPTPTPPPQKDDITFSPLGQTFGYLCAILYLFSRLPQIYLNYKRGTVEGLSLLFFLFACLGNLTYVISIMAYIPPGAEVGRGGGAGAGWSEEEKAMYWRYVAVNASWLVGSVGTLALDMVIFAQFFWYRDQNELLDGYLDYASDDADSEIDAEAGVGSGRNQADVNARSRVM